MKNIIALAAALLFSAAASAQIGVESGASALAQVNPSFDFSGPSSSKETITHKGAGQWSAASAPSVFGAVGNAAGCPVLEGGSAGIAFINGSKTSARELPGCMSLLMAAVTSNINPDDNGVITFKEKTMLMPLCDFPAYRARIKVLGYQLKNGVPVICAEDDATVARADRARLGQTAEFQSANLEDPDIRRRGSMPPLQ